MNDLDLLLSEATADLDNVEKARRKLRKFNVSENETLALQKVISAYEETHNWHSIGLVLLVQRQNCSCGYIHEFVQGEFLRQQHLRVAGTSRMVPNNWPQCNLPRSIEYHDSATNLCTNCAKEWK